VSTHKRQEQILTKLGGTSQPDIKTSMALQIYETVEKKLS